ncbi:MAG: ATP-binding cassette domain-containing protein [Acidobacteria bacterium]|nr:ATP-binding cassette domain-containing protein [Acidobacteriota bacterium]MDA1237293.1 ATP-binding cassette domain-containing protein [Acidobacteriota bacterium]
MIEATNLSKRFGETVALDGLSFTSRNGRIVGLLGPNGAGKTTALRILYGLLKADSGAVTIDGSDVESNKLEARRKIGALPDIQGLYPRLTARENIYYFGRLHGIDEKTLKRRTGKLIEQFDMGSIADRSAQGFSHGERMKTSLARALVHDPPNVLLDEPTNGLDVPSVRALRQVISNLRSDGRSVIFSSHVMQEVAALCDDIVIVARGKAVAVGSPDDIRRQAGCEDLEEAFVRLAGPEAGSAL